RYQFLYFYFHLWLGQLPVEKPAVMRFIIDEQRARYSARPARIQLRTKIIGIGLVKPQQRRSILSTAGKIGDTRRIIVRKIQTDQDQLHTLVRVARNCLLEIRDLFVAGLAEGS